MSTFSQAADYNHAGIELLKQGQYMQALNVFKESSRIIQSFGRENGIQSCSSNLTRSCHASDGRESHQETSPASYTTGPCHPTHSMPVCSRLDTDGCFMVCTPLELDSSEKLQLSSAAAVVLFNMALTYHLLPVVSCQRVAAHRHALSLYEMAYNLALADLDSEACSRLTMVTLVNMALILKELGKSQEAEQCLVDLAEYITALEQEQSNQESSSQRTDFLLKATLLLRSSLGAAAA